MTDTNRTESCNAKLRGLPGRRDPLGCGSPSGGFTLLELLVVVAIVGIISAIAVPQYASYRQTGFDARARSDLRNAATAEEAYFATFGEYVPCSDAGCASKLPNFQLSSTVTIKMEVQAGGSEFSGTASSSRGSRTFTYDSALGGMQN